jgi:uncharacterized protein YbjT (DUF2867 family)
MEVWLSPRLGFDYVNGRAIIYGSGEQPIGWVSYRDVAGFAVDAVTAGGAPNRTLPVGGPENLSPHEVVRIFETMTGRAFDIDRVSEAALERQYAEAADPLGKTIAARMLGYAHGHRMEMAETLRIMPRALMCVRDYAAAVARPL